MNKNSKKRKKKKENKSSEEKVQQIKTTGQLIKEHHLIIWFFFFFPIALYKTYKYKILPKSVNIIITIFIALFLIVSIDTIVKPTRVADNKLKKQLIEKEDTIGTIISFEQYEIVEDYIVYDVITNNARYDVYIDTNFEIKAIKMVSNDSLNIYESHDFKENYKGVFSEIIKFVNNNDINISNNIENIVETSTKEQTLIIDGEEYKFECAFENIANVYDKDGNTIYTNDNLSLRLNQEMYKKVVKNFPQTKDLDYVSTIVFNDDNYEIYFYTKDTKLYRLQVYTTGKISVSVTTSDLNETN